MSKQLATFDKVHQEKNSELILEYVVHAHNKRMLNMIKNLLLKLQGVHLLVFNHDVFSDALHRVYLIGFSMSHLKNFAKSSLSDYLNQLKIFQFGIIFLAMLEYQFCVIFTGNTLLDLIVILVRIFLLLIVMHVVLSLVVLLIS